MTNLSTQTATIFDLVSVRPLPDGTYEGVPRATARGSVFGGQLAGQTMSAAAATVDEKYPWPTSLQLYFIAAPDPAQPIHYETTRRRDGGRFAWRNVIARQGDRVVVEALAAFQSQPSPDAPCDIAAHVPAPEDLPSPQDVAARYPDEVGDYFDRLGVAKMDTRFVQGPPPLRLAQGSTEPRHQLWLHASELGELTPHQVGCCLAYLSDVNVLATPMISIGRLGHGISDFASSFDHNVRFYGALTEIPWLIYDQHASAVAGHTLEAHGRMATRDGRLVATVTQQGVLMVMP